MTTTTPPTLPQFSATVFAADTAAVRDFYVDLFGLDVASDVGWFTSLRRGDEPWEVCVWDPGHESVPDAVRAGAAAGAAPLLAFVVDGPEAVDAAERAARERGAPVVTPAADEPWGQRHVFLQDPAGTIVDVVAFIEPDPAWMAAHM
jgi:catechol 2,3-dioxygenase-like lactoylglutathione lyase family enzyme